MLIRNLDRQRNSPCPSSSFRSNNYWVCWWTLSAAPLEQILFTFEQRTRPRQNSDKPGRADLVKCSAPSHSSCTVCANERPNRCTVKRSSWASQWGHSSYHGPWWTCANICPSYTPCRSLSCFGCLQAPGSLQISDIPDSSFVSWQGLTLSNGNCFFVCTPAATRSSCNN